MLLFFLCSCSYVATTLTKPKSYDLSQTDISKSANRIFWDNFHLGNYDSISAIIDKLNNALQQQPNDLITTTHLGFVHIWSLSEIQRLNEPHPGIREHIFLSKTYFH